MNSINKRSPKPVAPPAFRPQPVPKVLQRKISPSSGSTLDQPRKPVAPPVYRPQPVTKILQKQAAIHTKPGAVQATQKPISPPVYRPEAKKILQPKAIAPQRKRPTSATPRLDHKGIVQRQTPFKTKTPPTLKGSSVVQRAREHLPYELNSVMVPDIGMETYTKHVKMRTRHFFR